jgi:DNA-directed RNA polymerase specialized sigma24 family protein
MNAFKEGRSAVVCRHGPDRSGSNALRDEELLPLVEGTIAGDEQSWHALWIVLDPRIERIAGRFRVLSRLSGSWDDRRNVVVLVLERLRADGFARLQALREVLLQGDGSGWAWIAALARRTALNYARGHEEHLGAGVREDGARYAALVPFTDAVADDLPVSMRVIQKVEALRVEVCADQVLPPVQRQALCLWLQGHEDGEIARELALGGARAAARTVHAALGRLRYRCAAGAPRNRPGVLMKWPETVSRRGEVARSTGAAPAAGSDKGD